MEPVWGLHQHCFGTKGGFLRGSLETRAGPVDQLESLGIEDVLVGRHRLGTTDVVPEQRHEVHPHCQARREVHPHRQV